MARRSTGASAGWALNDEAIRYFGYMQMKKTLDAALVLIERIYGERPRVNYYFGTSQALSGRLKDAAILPHVTGSDHCPVTLTLG